MKQIVNAYLNLVFKTGIAIVILATLFLFTNTTTEFYETPKFLVLLSFTGIFLFLLTIKFTTYNRVSLVRTPLDIPLLLLLVVAIVSTVLSSSPYISILGNQTKIHGSLVSIIVYVLFYFLLVNFIRNLKDIKQITSFIVISGAILSVITLLSYAGIKFLPTPWVTGANFTPGGSSFTTTAILAILLPIVVMRIFSGRNILHKVLNSLFLALFAITIILTGVLSTYAAALVGLGLTLLVNKQHLDIKKLKPVEYACLIIPFVASVMIIFLSFMPPVGKYSTPLYNLAKNFPREVQLDFENSWKISVSAFRDSPFWGTGPSTYLFDFTIYKPIAFNATKLWNVRLDQPFNEYLTTLATLGGVGLIAILVFTTIFISLVYRMIMAKNVESQSTHELAMALGISGIAFFVILALHVSSLPLLVIGFIVISLFMAITYLTINAQSSISGSWNGGFKDVLTRVTSNIYSNQITEETFKIDVLPPILIIVTLALTLFTFFMAGKLALADYHHRLALNAVSANQGVLAYNELILAEKFNPYSDLYHADLAQTNFALANALAQAKAPTDSSPNGNFSDQDKQNIQILLQQSINEGRTATTLSPKSAINWEILGALYRQISGVAQNALIFSLDSYGRAIFLDPLNPQLRLSVGGTYYAIKNYDLAIRFFTDSINLKPDYANGYYNLSVALKDKGDLQSAIVAGEKVVQLVDKNSADYKTAKDYLNDLKSKTAKTTEQNSDLGAPTSTDKGPLQQKELPKVLNLPQPEKIATPPAIKKPAATPTPTP